MRILLATILLMPALTSAQSLQNEFRAQNPTKDAKTKPSRYSLSVSYRLATDLMEQVSPPTYYNSLNLTGMGQVKDWFNVLGGVDVSYVAVGEEIPTEGNNPSFNDFYLGVTRTNKLSPRFVLNTEIINTFPTSQRSRFEGYKSVLDLNLALRAKVYKDMYTVTNAFTLERVFNTNEYSPTTEEYNPEWAMSYNLRNSLRLMKRYILSFAVSARSTTYTDGTSILTYGNSTAVAFEYDRFFTALSYENGQDIPQREVDMWFINHYRKMVVFRVGYVF